MRIARVWWIYNHMARTLRWQGRVTYLGGAHSAMELLSFQQFLLDLVKGLDPHAKAFKWKQLRKWKKHLLVKILLQASEKIIWQIMAFSRDEALQLTAKGTRPSQDRELFYHLTFPTSPQWWWAQILPRAKWSDVSVQWEGVSEHSTSKYFLQSQRSNSSWHKKCT